MDNWVESFPFLFSIVLKLFTNLLRSYHVHSLVSAIPSDYGLTPDQKHTIGDRSFAASERAVYIVTVFSSILAAVVLTAKNRRIDLALYVVFIFGLIGTLGVLWLHSRELDFLDLKWHGIRHGWMVTALLILIDAILLFIIIGSDYIPQTLGT